MTEQRRELPETLEEFVAGVYCGEYDWMIHTIEEVCLRRKLVQSGARDRGQLKVKVSELFHNGEKILKVTREKKQ